MRLEKLFTEHPSSVGESYFQHLCHAVGFALLMLLGGLGCLVHAFLPFLFVRTSSQIIVTLHLRMALNRSKAALPKAPPAQR